mmetsp:Transcript_17650/g.48491  ORF Transcript_17650/g.48491 Transcript_17650/m.48491 type:complete len:427 (+) Transcript_17650:98-1378(+)
MPLFSSKSTSAFPRAGNSGTDFGRRSGGSRSPSPSPAESSRSVGSAGSGKGRGGGGGKGRGRGGGSRGSVEDALRRIEACRSHIRQIRGILEMEKSAELFGTVDMLLGDARTEVTEMQQTGDACLAEDRFDVVEQIANIASEFEEVQRLVEAWKSGGGGGACAPGGMNDDERLARELAAQMEAEERSRAEPPTPPMSIRSNRSMPGTEEERTDGPAIGDPWAGFESSSTVPSLTVASLTNTDPATKKKEKKEKKKKSGAAWSADTFGEPAVDFARGADELGQQRAADSAPEWDMMDFPPAVSSGVGVSFGSWGAAPAEAPSWGTQPTDFEAPLPPVGSNQGCGAFEPSSGNSPGLGWGSASNVGTGGFDSARSRGTGSQQATMHIRCSYDDIANDLEGFKAHFRSSIAGAAGIPMERIRVHAVRRG